MFFFNFQKNVKIWFFQVNFSFSAIATPNFTLIIKTGTVGIRISRAIDLCQKIYMLDRGWKFAMTGTLFFNTNLIVLSLFLI